MLANPQSRIRQRLRRGVSKVEALVVIAGVAIALALVLGLAKRISEIVDGWR